MNFEGYNFLKPEPNLQETFNVLVEKIELLPDYQKLFVYKAIALASVAHAGQKRADKAEYIIHPLRVTLLTLKYLDEKLITEKYILICSAILHDAIEDSELQIKEVETLINISVAELADKLTRYKPIHETPSQRKIGKRKSWEQIIKSSYDARLIKSCDYFDNMISWNFIPKTNENVNKLPRWLNEAKELYIPLARTVGEDIYYSMNELYNYYLEQGLEPSETSLI